MLPFFALLLIGGCSQPLSAHISTGSTTPMAKQTSVGTSVAFDLGGWIHVQSVSGFVCGDSPLAPPGLLVLPKVQPTYDQGTLQIVKNYVTTSYKNPGDIIDASGNLTGHRDTVPYPAFSSNPDTFRVIAVSGIVDVCDEILHITNIRNVPIQITPTSVTLTAATKTNNQHYNVIEGCSLLSLRLPCTLGRRGGGESDYGAMFPLHSGKAQTIIPAKGPTNALTLLPGEVARVHLSYEEVSGDNLSFSLIPSFTLGLPSGQQTPYPAPQLQESFAFALFSQYSCYSLQGQHFIKVPVTGDNWCM